MREVIVNGEVKLEHESARIPVRTRRSPGERDAARIAKAQARVDAMADKARAKYTDKAVHVLRAQVAALAEIVETIPDAICRQHRQEMLTDLETIVDRIESWYADPPIAEVATDDDGPQIGDGEF